MKVKNIYLLSVVIFVALIGFIHSYAISNFLYWHYKWLDLVVHALGGAWVAMIYLWLAYLSGYKKFVPLSDKRGFYFSTITAVFVGIIWEVFEYVGGLIFVDTRTYIIDTILDLIMDGAGAIIFTYLFYRFKKQDGVETEEVSIL